ncbi:SHOCT domain-containing protein [Streptomyces sp. NPDC057694]|uniref:SHOCT domain-containing protein n=1 Tax=Streptomyces sp. NPDC057694 TaxID=3346216 RepID=UPI0036873A8A
MSDMPRTASKVKDKHAQRWLHGLQGHLVSGETVRYLGRINAMRGADAFAVTSIRVMSFLGLEVGGKGLFLDVPLGEIETAEIRSSMGGKKLVVHTRAGEDISFGALVNADAEDNLTAVREAVAEGPDTETAKSWTETQAAAEAAWGATRFIGAKLSDKARRVLEQHCAATEAPWFVLTSSGAGVLAAFEDRCMIIKAGGMAAMMAGATGGARITSFAYREITGIEYNSGLSNGVLEILTASYQGTANKDFWRGTRSSRNADSHDPYTLSNTLPLPKRLYQEALPWLNELRSRVTDSKGQVAVLASPPSAAKTLADEIRELAALHEAGALSDEEFTEAKKAAMARK